jgi:hypothetical protein
VEVIAFPNPSRDEVTIQVSGTEAPLSVEVFDAAGRSVITRSSFIERTRIEPTELASGTYYARISAQGTYLTTVQLSLTR